MSIDLRVPNTASRATRGYERHTVALRQHDRRNRTDVDHHGSLRGPVSRSNGHLGHRVEQARAQGNAHRRPGSDRIATPPARFVGNECVGDFRYLDNWPIRKITLSSGTGIFGKKQ